ncbi:hypothetical protein ACIQVO_31720 [Streptomyces sp. NPDC101062]|uniref:hypothetical protein n=1 Tax=unclassified Streptomyces TaxID=2593676 RepID=UPI00380B5795
MDVLLALGREAVTVHGKTTRAVLRNAVHEAGLSISEDRLTELKTLLLIENETESGARKG